MLTYCSVYICTYYCTYTYVCGFAQHCVRGPSHFCFGLPQNIVPQCCTPGARACIHAVFLNTVARCSQLKVINLKLTWACKIIAKVRRDSLVNMRRSRHQIMVRFASKRSFNFGACVCLSDRVKRFHIHSYVRMRYIHGLRTSLLFPTFQLRKILGIASRYPNSIQAFRELRQFKQNNMPSLPLWRMLGMQRLVSSLLDSFSL